METLLLLFGFITIYLISRKLANHTLLSNHKWFWNLKDYLYTLFPDKSKYIEQVFCNKIFFCLNCNAFWIGLILFASGASLNLFSSTIALILSLLNYLMQVEQSINEDAE